MTNWFFCGENVSAVKDIFDVTWFLDVGEGVFRLRSKKSISEKNSMPLQSFYMATYFDMKRSLKSRLCFEVMLIFITRQVQ